MEKNVIVEGNCKRSKSILVSKTGSSLIGSTSVALASVPEKLEAGMCGHFSIRGYVAEIRRKDSKICWPFSKVGKHNELEEQAAILPPLKVAEFRWWRRHNCLQKIDATGAPREVAANYCNTGFEANVTCSHQNIGLLVNGDAQKLKHTSEEKIFGARKANADTSINANGDDFNQSLCSEKKEKEVQVVLPVRKEICISEGHDDGAEGNVNQVIQSPTCGATKVNSFLAGEKVAKGLGNFWISLETDKHGCNLPACETANAFQPFCHGKNASEMVTLKSKCDDGLVEFCKPNFGGHEVSGVGLENRNLKGISNSSTEICHKENQGLSRNNFAKMNEQQSGVVTDHGISKVVDPCIHNNEALIAAMGSPRQFHSLGPDITDYELSENDENLIENNLHDQVHSNQHGKSDRNLNPRKTRKVRLLTDIMQSEALRESSEIHGSNRDVNFDHIKKETIHSKGASDSSTGIDVHPGSRSQVTVQGIDGKVVLGNKRKRKVLQDEDEPPLSKSFAKALEKMKIVSKEYPEAKQIDNATESIADASVEVGLHPGFPGFKNYEMEEGMPKGIQIRRNMVSKGIRDEAVLPKSAQDSFTRNDLQSGPKSYVAAQKIEGKSILGKKKSMTPQIDDGKSSLKAWQKGVNQIIQKYTEKKHNSAATVPIKSSEDAFSGKGVHHGLKSHMATHRKAIVNKKRKNISQVKGGGSSPMCWSKDSSGTFNNGNTADVEEHPTSQCDQVANEICEQEVLDDIPMEIVELMAKNQHERRLFYSKAASENMNCLPETTEIVKVAEMMDFTVVPGNEVSRLLPKNSWMQNFQSSNTGSATCTTGQPVAPTKQKSDGYPSHVNGEYNSIRFNISQPDQSLACVGSSSVSQYQEKVSSGVQFPVTGSRNCGSQTCRWNGDTGRNTSFGTCLPSSEAFHTCRTASHQSSCREAHNPWSSVVTDRLSLGIKSPQKLATESSICNLLSQQPNSLLTGNLNGDHGLKSMNPIATHFQKPKGSFNTESNKRTHPEYPFSSSEKGNEYHQKMVGPMDLYTNETISAMHLLRLMDWGACTSSPVNVDENLEKFPKHSPFPHHNHPNELSGLKVGVSRTSKTSMHPPSFDYSDRNHHKGKSCEQFPLLPTVNADGSSSQDHNFKRSLAKQMARPLKYQGKERANCFYSHTQTRGRRSHRPSSRDDCSGKNHESVPIHELQKGFLSASDSIRFPISGQKMEDSNTHVELEANKKDEIVFPVQGNRKTEFCTINRNPADFTVPEAGNMYMIGGRDLKKRKMIHSRDRVVPNNQDGHKRQRMMKLTAIQEHVQL